MKLHIIVPYHGESKDVYYRLFESLNNQENIDFNNISIYICRSDGIPVFPDIIEFTNISPRTTYLSQFYEFSGPGNSRQIALNLIYGSDLSEDNLDGVLFCDCDDIISDKFAISSIFYYIEYNSNYNVLIFPYNKLENGEVQDIGEEHSCQFTLLSKVFRLKTLKQYYIHNPKELDSNEDYYFTYCIDSISPLNKYNFNYSFYLWVVREDSISHTASSNWFPEPYVKAHIIMWNEYKKWREANAPFSPIMYQYGSIIIGLSYILFHSDRKLDIAESQKVFEEYNDIISMRQSEDEVLSRASTKVEECLQKQLNMEGI